MNATTIDTATDDTTDRRTTHALCSHPTTKVARAACRRARLAVWVAITRDDVAKGDTIRVTSNGGAPVEGELLGWGKARLILRNVEGARVTFDVADIVATEALGA